MVLDQCHCYHSTVLNGLLSCLQSGCVHVVSNTLAGPAQELNQLLWALPAEHDNNCPNFQEARANGFLQSEKSQASDLKEPRGNAILVARVS